MGVRAYLTVPLPVRGRTIGALTLVASREGRTYHAVDLAMAEELGRRAAVALDNARLYRDAQEAVRLRDEFLSIASHELKTPITSLQLAVQSLLRMMRPGSPWESRPEAVRMILEAAERTSRRVGRLIAHLLDGSRIAAGRLEFAPPSGPVELAPLVREVIDGLHEDLAASGSTIALHVEADVSGEWDRVRVEQVVTNLLSNAIKYGAGRPIEVHVGADGARARVDVRDRGIGIPRDSLARIFERFERAVDATHYGGLGLGLYIVRAIVEAMDGTVTVVSEQGLGSTFTVSLPVRQA
jgi:signal transduction histidine kinase